MCSSDLDAFRLGAWPHHVGDVLEEAADVHGLFRDGELAGLDLRQLEDRVDHAEEVLRRRLERVEAIDLLERADIPNGRVNDVEALAKHEQLAARGRWHEFPSEVGPISLLGHPMNLSSMPQRTDRIPALGEDSETIVSELGFSADEVRDFANRGVNGAREGGH